MFTLKLDKSKFYKVKSGQSGEEISSTLNAPCMEVFAGKIIEVIDCEMYTVKPLESYESIAKKFAVGEEELQRVNLNKPLYPTARIIIPK